MFTTAPAGGPCPSCGYCPTCGRSNHSAYWPHTYPFWTSSGIQLQEFTAGATPDTTTGSTASLQQLTFSF